MTGPACPGAQAAVSGNIHLRATVAVTRKLPVIMYSIWITGDEFDFGGPAVAAKAAWPIERGVMDGLARDCGPDDGNGQIRHGPAWAG